MNGVRVLAIDDDPVIRLMMRHQLESHGISFTDASSGDEAVAEYDPADFDVIVCDLEMPGLSGLEVFKSWAARSGTPFILVTGYLEEAEVSIDGIHAYLPKPVATRELIEAIEQASMSKTTS